MRVGLAGLVGLVVCGCGSVSEQQPDSTIADASADANIDAMSARCDVTKPFGPPVPVGGINTASDEAYGWLSADHLTIYFSRDLSGTDANLYVATRAQPIGSFTDVVLLSGANTPGWERRPALTADGLTLFLGGDGSASERDIRIATRTSTAASFSGHTPVAVINSSSNEYDPWISDDGLTMYFVSYPAGETSNEIYKTTRPSMSSSFSTPVPVGELNTTDHELAPVLSKDGLEIFFGKLRGSGPNEAIDIFHATRSTPVDGFGTPRIVGELSSSTSFEYPSWLSSDRCQLMFTSNRSGNNDIWIAMRPQ